MTKSYWVITRPKRKLLLVPDLLRIFAAVVEEKRWHGNRGLQIEFEQALTDAQWKAQNVSEDGSGGRTYAALLYMLGLWYEHMGQVFITNAAKEIIEGDPPVPVLTKQLLDMQFPSAYSIKPTVNVSRDFRLWPYRFLLNLLMDTDLSGLSEEEIAFCVVPFAKSMTDLAKCNNLVKSYRTTPDLVRRKALEASQTTADNLKNIANTAINQLEYTGLFEEVEDRRSLEFTDSAKDQTHKLLSRARSTLIADPDSERDFQRRYGSGLRKTKDYSSSLRETMPVSPNERLILEKYYVMASNQPVTSLSDDVVNRLSTETGAKSIFVRQVLSKLPLSIQADQFKETYLKLAIGGNSTATDFERKTQVLLLEGFGFKSEWVGARPRHPDIIIYVDLAQKFHGIIDTKSYSKYSLPLDHKNKMAFTYIPAFSEVKYQGETFKLAFFAYVAGGYSGGIARSFGELRRMTNVPGSYITAWNLLKLLDMHRQNSFSSLKMTAVLSSGGEVLAANVK